MRFCFAKTAFALPLAALIALQSLNAQIPSPKGASESKGTSEVFGELTNSCILNAVRGRATAFAFQPEANAGLKQYLDGAVQAALIASGLVLYEKSATKRTNLAELSYQVQSATLSYRSLGVQKLGVQNEVGQNEVEVTARRFEISLFIKLVGADEKVLVAESVSATRLDTVKTSTLTDLEDRRFAETRQSETKSNPPPNLLESVAAPVAVVGAIGIIVFLFFSVRSR
jgi:hypothetical protein